MSDPIEQAVDAIHHAFTSGSEASPNLVASEKATIRAAIDKAFGGVEKELKEAARLRATVARFAAAHETRDRLMAERGAHGAKRPERRAGYPNVDPAMIAWADKDRSLRDELAGATEAILRVAREAAEHARQEKEKAG